MVVAALHRRSVAGSSPAARTERRSKVLDTTGARLLGGVQPPDKAAPDRLLWAGIERAGMMPSRIFISYRRGDEPGFAHALYARLEQVFSNKQLFMDVEGGIPAGADFVEVLEAQVAQCDVLLALIGQ